MARSIYYYTDSHAFGGAEKAMLMSIDGLDRAAWTPTLLIEEDPGAEPLAELAREAGIAVRLTPPLPLGVGGARRVPELVRLLRSEGPDVFHAHLSWPMAAKFGLAAAIASRIRAVVATVHLIPTMQLSRSSIMQLRAIAAGVDRYIAVSRDVRSQLVERYHWPGRKIEVVYNAVDVTRFDVAADPAVRAELSGGSDLPVVLTPARLHEQKGHEFLLRAAGEVPGAVFAIAGDGPERPALEALAERLGVSNRVTFLGSRDDVPALLAASDVFALPSLYEGTSLAILEAMAAHCPVVSSAIGGTDELIDDGESGLLVPPGDPRALGEALRRLVASPELRASFATRARDRVELEFTQAAMVGRTSTIYEELLAGNDASDA